MEKSYIISNGNIHLRQNKSSKYEIVKDIKDATRWEYKKANNVLNGLGKIYKENLFRVKLIESEKKVTDPHVDPVNLDCEITDKIEDLLKFVKQLKDRHDYLIYKLNEVDFAIMDLEHAAEFFVLDVCRGYKLYKMLHNMRVERRSYKDEIQIIENTLGTCLNVEGIENLKKSISGLETRKYTPRVLKEIFES